MANITNAQVRERLRTLNSAAEIPDAILESHAYLTTGDSWLAVILANSSLTLAGLNENQKNLAKAAEIAFVCHKIIAAAPLNDNEKGPIKIKDIDTNSKKLMLDELKKEWENYLELIGCEINVSYVGNFGLDTLQNRLES